MFWFLFQVKMYAPKEGGAYTGFIYAQGREVSEAWSKATNRTGVRELKFSHGPFLTMEEAFSKELSFSDRFS